jgi:hypothetical protein
MVVLSWIVISTEGVGIESDHSLVLHITIAASAVDDILIHQGYRHQRGRSLELVY